MTYSGSESMKKERIHWSRTTAYVRELETSSAVPSRPFASLLTWL